jgi:hypothetical protein
MAQIPKVAWIAIAGLAGCGAHAAEPAPTPSRGPSGTAEVEPTPAAPTANGPAPSTPESTAAVVAIDENLARLRALDVFEVGELIVEMPAEALNCYGPKPCAGSEPAVAAARTTAAERLVAFTESVVAAAAKPYDSYACDANIDVNLEALRSLRVVEVGSFIRSEPVNSAFCYNLPCQSDIDAANTTNHTRAAKLESIAIALPEL